MDDAVQALCFFAGAGSIFYGEKLLTTGNPDVEADRALFRRLDLHPMEVVEHADILEDSAASCGQGRSEEHTSELQSLMRLSYAVFCLHKKKKQILRRTATVALAVHNKTS